jgi:hypothetical protein
LTLCLSIWNLMGFFATGVRTAEPKQVQVLSVTTARRNQKTA